MILRKEREIIGRLKVFVQAASKKKHDIPLPIFLPDRESVTDTERERQTDWLIDSLIFNAQGWRL